MKREPGVWYGICKCGVVHKCPNGKTECCNELTTLVRDAKGTPFKNEREVKPQFSDPEYGLFSDMKKREAKERYVQSWRYENEK